MFTIRKKAIALCLCGAMAINLQAFDIGKSLSNAVSKSYGGNIDLNKIASGSGLDLSKLGLDNLNLGDIINLDLGSLSTMLSLHCDYSLKIPKAPSGFCDFTNSSVGIGAFNFNRTLNLGKCKVSAGVHSSGIGAGFGKKIKSYCSYIKNKKDALWAMPIAISDVLSKEQFQSSFDSLLHDDSPAIPVNSLYLPQKNIKYNDVKLSNGYPRSKVISPDGVLGFDRIYKNDSSIPKSLATAFNKDDYKKYRAYEFFAESYPFSHRKGLNKNDSLYVDFSKMKISPSSFIELESQKQINIAKILSSYSTPYVTEDLLKKELSDIKKKYGNLSGSTSAQLKADYLKKKKKTLEEFFNPNIKKDKGKTILAKAMRDLANYERLKFAEKEEDYRRTHSYIVNPSGLKVLTKRKEDQISYMYEIMWQQTQEVRRKAENERMIKMKQETLKLLAQKVFVSSLEYEPSIAQKEIDEILGQ